MGTCEFCGEKAGFLKKNHPECVARRDAGWSEILALTTRAATAADASPDLAQQVAAIASRSHLEHLDPSMALAAGWEAALNAALDDDLISEQEERSLISFAEAHDLDQTDLDANGAYSRFVQALTLRDIMEGKLPQRMRFDGGLPFNLMKNERVIWVFPNTEYIEQQTKTHYVGGSQGVSVRVAKGLYYRANAFKGHPVKTTESVTMGSGLLGVTDKHLYFAGPAKSFRIKYDKIVSFEPYSDGIGVQRDAQTAKPQGFITGNGWFTYNLVTNLAKGPDLAETPEARDIAGGTP